MNNSITVTMLLDTGSQLTMLNNEVAPKLMTKLNTKISDIVAIPANGLPTDKLVELHLKTSTGKPLTAFYSPDIKSNLLSVDTMTKQLNKSAIITKHETHLIDSDSHLMNKIEELLCHDNQNTHKSLRIPHEQSLIPVDITFDLQQNSIIHKLANVNALQQFPFKTLIGPMDHNPLFQNITITKQDRIAFRLHDYFHFKITKMSQMLKRPMSPAVELYIRECYVCKMRTLNNKKRHRRPEQQLDENSLNRLNNLKLNPNFSYTIHLDTIKIDTKLQSNTVKSYVTVVLKPINYVHLIPISTTQPTMTEVHRKVLKFIHYTIQSLPSNMIIDRGNEFNQLTRWADNNNIPYSIAGTGDSQYNGIVERFNKDIKVQFGLLTSLIPEKKIPYLLNIISREISLRLNSDRRNLQQTPNYYMFGKDVSDRYIAKGIPLFADVKIKTINGQFTVGTHIGYHLNTNRALVQLIYRNRVQYRLQAINHQNIESLGTYNLIAKLDYEIIMPKEFQKEIQSIQQDTNKLLMQTDQSPALRFLEITEPTVKTLTTSTTLNTNFINSISAYKHPGESFPTNKDIETTITKIKEQQRISIKEALRTPIVREAMRIEIQKWIEAKAITPHQKRNQPVKPTYARAFWIFGTKTSADKLKVKARLITIIPSTVNTKILPEHYSPVTNKISVTAILHKTLLYNLKLATLDVSGAFLQAKTNHPLLLLKEPDGFNELSLEVDPTFVTSETYKVEKALYGLKDSPLQWYKTLISMYKENGFESSPNDNCLITDLDDPLVNGTIHVDDILYTINPQGKYDEILNTLKKRKIKVTTNSTGSLKYLGLTYITAPDKITINLSDYIQSKKDENIRNDKKQLYPFPPFFSTHYELIRAIHKGTFLINSDPNNEPIKQLTLARSDKLSQYNNDHIAKDFEANESRLNHKLNTLMGEFTKYTRNIKLYIRTTEDYQKYLGILGYITSIHRHELSIYHLILSTFNTRYNEQAAYALQHLVSYTFNTPLTEHHIHKILPQDNNYRVEVFTDANWSRFDSSYSGVVITINNEFIFAKSKKQQTISTSTFIAELRALYTAVITTYEILTRFSDICKINYDTITIYCDNKAVNETITSSIPLNSTIYANQLSHQVLFLRQEFQQRKFNIQYIQSKNNPADLYTKPLAKQEFDNILKLPPMSAHIHSQH